MSGRDELGTLFDDGFSGGFVGCYNDESKVLGSHELRTGFVDDIESSFEPSGGFGKSGQVSGLPMGQRKQYEGSDCVGSTRRERA